MNQSPTPPPFYGGQDVARQTNAVMKRVYVRMFIGLLVSAFCALGIASSPSLLQMFYGNAFMMWVPFIAMLVMAWVLPSKATKMSTGAVLACFVVFSALMGITLAPIFLVYRMGTIVYTFFITAGTFGAMSVYGYFTKTDLTKIGSFLFMALIGPDHRERSQYFPCQFHIRVDYLDCRSADLHRSHRLGHPAGEGSRTRQSRPRHVRQTGYDRSAQPLSRLH